MPTLADSQPISIRLENMLIEQLKLIARCKSVALGHKVTYTDLIREAIVTAYPVREDVTRMSEIKRICWTQVNIGVERMKLTGDDVCIISHAGSRHPIGSLYTVVLIEHEQAAREHGLYVIPISIVSGRYGKMEETDDYVLLSKISQLSTERLTELIPGFHIEQTVPSCSSAQERFERGYRIHIIPDKKTSRIFAVTFEPKTSGQVPKQPDGLSLPVPKWPKVLVDMNHELPLITFVQGEFNDPELSSAEYEEEAIKQIGTPEIFRIGNIDLVDLEKQYPGHLPRQIGAYIRAHSARHQNCYLVHIVFSDGQEVRITGDYAEVNMRLNDRGEYGTRFRVRFTPETGRTWEYLCFPSKIEDSRV